MHNQKEVRPPSWATALLQWYCRRELLEDLEGDLHEYFERNVKSKGVSRARLIYVIDVLKFFRSYTVRKPEFIKILIHWIMLSSYIKTSGRTLVRNKLFSFINVIGLAIGMSVGLLMIAFVADLKSYDKFHEKGDRIYRVTTEFSSANRNMTLASTSVLAADRMQENVTGYDKMVLMRRGFRGDISYGSETLQLSGLWSTETFFDVFTFPLVEGNASGALKEPYSIVITETAAKKLFGKSDALGQTITVKGEEDIQYTITGVMKDIPKFSHLQFEVLISFSTIRQKEKDNAVFFAWNNVWQNYIYLVLPPDGDVKSLENGLARIAEKQNATSENDKIQLKLQPLHSIALGPDLSNEIGSVMLVSVLWIIFALVIVVIVSACFNYTNLSIARSIRRSREVGIRKVIGALKGHVFAQFLTESVIIALLALVLSFLIFLLIRPHFLGIDPQFTSMVTLELTPELIGYFALFAVLVGLMAGFLPAFFFSKINAISVLKNSFNLTVFRRINMRKSLIVLQYTFSLMFITGTLIINEQHKHFLSFDLGFNTENVLNINLQGNKASLLKRELEQLPEVSAVSVSQMITSVGSYWGGYMKYNKQQDSILVWYNRIDENYIPLHGHKLLAGRNLLPKSEGQEETEIIVNEQVLKQLDIAGKDPAKAIGEVVVLEKKKLQIAGVMKDFHYGKVDSKIDPVIFSHLDKEGGNLNLKVSTTDPVALMNKIEAIWKKFDKVHPLDASFYDEQIEQAYSEYSVMVKVIGFMAVLAISIASIGLLGMIVFTTETKLKEISIRKVLGASEGNLIYLLSKGFIVLLLIAALIALPVTYFFFETVVLSDIVYRAPIRLPELLTGFIAVLAIALILIGSQTLKVSRTNPAAVLKNE